jgi:hypothetical protein
MSDHKDAHEALKYPECDIGDFWAYHVGQPRETQTIVLVMTVNVGEVGMVWYGPRKNRNSRQYTTVPHRLQSKLPKRFSATDKANDEFGGMLKLGDQRARLTDYLSFNPDAVYEFRFAMPSEANGTFEPALSFKVVFSGNGGLPGRKRKPVPQSMQLLKAVTDAGDSVERGDRSGTVIPLSSPKGGPRTSIGDEEIVASKDQIKLYAGHRQDPFYFDFEGVDSKVAHQYRKELCKEGAPSGGRSAAFSQAFNISAIVLELPVSEIVGDRNASTFRVWAATTRDGHPIDRAGLPLFNPTFLPKEHFEDVLDSFNATRYAAQYAAFAPLVDENLRRLGAQDTVGIDSLLPDALSIDLDAPAGLPNGRTLRQGDPTHHWIEKLDPGAYARSTRPEYDPDSPVKLLDRFPYLPPPCGDRQGWTRYTPSPDPGWPQGENEESSCDCYLDSREDPGRDHRENRFIMMAGAQDSTMAPPGTYPGSASY